MATDLALDPIQEALEDDAVRVGQLALNQGAPTVVLAERGYPFDVLDHRVWPPGKATHLRPEYSGGALSVEAVRTFVAALALRRYLTASVSLVRAPEAAQVALLKLLEEPGDLRVILYSADFSTLIEPLLSRCHFATLPPASPDLREAVLVAAGVPPDRAAKLPEDYPGSLASALRETSVDRGPVDELLSALAVRDAVRCFTASRQFTAQHAEILGLTIERHLAGITRVPALTPLPAQMLSSWASVLSLSSRGPSAGLAARWGLAEVLGASA